MDLIDVITERLFDYAGMFPPAALSFEDALREAAGHRGTLKRPGMVATDMVVRPEHLEGFTDNAMKQAGWRPGDECTIALVGIGLQEAEDAATTVHSFNNEHEAKDIPRRIVSLEPTLPLDLGGHEKENREALTILLDSLDPMIQIYIEPRWKHSDWKTNAQTLYQLLEEQRDERQFGLKVRCAGETALDHAAMTQVIADVTQNGYPLKVTQGLHHPIIEQRWDNQWGFLNLAMALWFTKAEGTKWRQEQTLELLKEDDPGAFTIAETVDWRGHGLDRETLRQMKREQPLSIGSCSIREPDDDLTRLFG